MDGAEDQSRTDDTWIFSPLLYHLSYLGVAHNLPHSFGRVNVEHTWTQASDERGQGAQGAILRLVLSARLRQRKRGTHQDCKRWPEHAGN